MWFTHASTRTTEYGAPSCLHLTGGHDRHPRQLGISLVELMIGMTIGMIALLVMVQTFSVSSGHKDNTVSGADATTAGHVALTLIERDLLNAGVGLIASECKTIKYLNAGGGAALEMKGMPVTIEPDPNAPSALPGRSDRITIRYSSSVEAPFAKATLTDPVDNPAAAMAADNPTGFSEGDLLVLNDALGNCALLQLTKAPNKLGQGKGGWLFVANKSSPYNPSGRDQAALIFPPGGYPADVGTFRSLGPGGIAQIVYRLQSRSTSTAPPLSDLQSSRDDMTTATGAQTITRDVVALRAQYGWWDSATNTVSFSSTIPAGAESTDLAAVRVGLLVRASQRDGSYTAPEKIQLFAYDSPIEITLGSEERKYRYRSFETVVPLRNSLWNRK